MELKLEELSYQREAIDAVVRLFEGQPRNTFDMACREGVRSNVLTIPTGQVRENLLAAIENSGIDKETASLDEALDFCIEMETGTGKTLAVLNGTSPDSPTTTTKSFAFSSSRPSTRFQLLSVPTIPILALFFAGSACGTPKRPSSTSLLKQRVRMSLPTRRRFVKVRSIRSSAP